MKIWVFTISYNEGYLMPFFLRHYSTFADRIIVWDEASTDGTREAVKRCKKAELRNWPHRGLDDEKFRAAQSSWYQEARGRADWVMWPDVDEFLWHRTPRPMLTCLKAAGYDLLLSQGFGMLPPRPPVDDGKSQIWQLWSKGVPTPNYDKLIIWNPAKRIDFDYGRHKLRSFDGRGCQQAHFKLLHYHWLGLEEMKKRNDRNISRVLDRKFCWNYLPEHDHSTQVGTLSWFRDNSKRATDVLQ